MFRSGVILILIGVASAHGALLLLLPGENPVPAKAVQQQMIQGVLLAAPAPVPKEPEKRKPRPKKQSSKKAEIKEKLIQPLREEPREKVVEVPVEIPEPVKEEVSRLPVAEVVKPIVEETPEELSPLSPDTEAKQVTVSPPRIDDAGHLNNPPPSYPRLSKRLREEGEVILELWVLEDGTVSEVKIKTSSGYPRLDKAALNAVKKWRYTPATRNGEVVAYRYQQPVQFSMK